MSLLERSQSILDQYQSQQLHGTQLKSELQARIDEASLKQSEDITQHTSSSNGDSTFAFVQHDPSRLAKDVSSQQDFTRRVKLMWSESNTLRKFTAHLMDPNSQDVSLVECKEAEDLRLNAKAELKSWKAAAQSRRDLLLRTSEALDSGAHYFCA